MVHIQYVVGIMIQPLPLKPPTVIPTAWPFHSCSQRVEEIFQQTLQQRRPQLTGEFKDGESRLGQDASVGTKRAGACSVKEEAEVRHSLLKSVVNKYLILWVSKVMFNS